MKRGKAVEIAAKRYVKKRGCAMKGAHRGGDEISKNEV